MLLINGFTLCCFLAESITACYSGKCTHCVPYKLIIYCTEIDVQGHLPVKSLTLTMLGATIDAQWERMGDVGSARCEPALLPPCPTIRVLSYSS